MTEVASHANTTDRPPSPQTKSFELSEIVKDHPEDKSGNNTEQVDIPNTTPRKDDSNVKEEKKEVILVVTEDKKTIRELEEKDDDTPKTPDIYKKKNGNIITWAHKIKHVAKKYHVVGPQQQITVKTIEDALQGNIKDKLTKSEFESFQEAQKKLKEEKLKHKEEPSTHHEQDNYLDAISFNQLAKMLPINKNLVPENEFHNLNETFSSNPKYIIEPKNLKELQDIIIDCNKNNRRAKVVGAAHSWTPVFPEDGSTMITLDKFRGISHDVSSDSKDEWTCTFGVGEKVKDVDKYLSQVGLCVNTSIVMNHVGYGGLISMGCHGTGWKLKTISDLCVGMKLVDGHGNLRTFTKKDNRGVVWDALLTNLGVFGVVYEYTISVFKDFNVLVRDYKMPSRSIFGEGAEGELRKIVLDCHSSQFFWMPFNDKIWAKTFKETDRPVNKPQIKYVMETFTNWVDMNFGVKSVDVLAKAAPITPEFMKAAFATFPNDYERVETITNAIHWEKFLDAIQIMCMEFAFPVRPDVLDDWNNVCKSVRYVQRRIYELEKEGKFPLNLALEMRFVSGSEGLLSTANGNEHTCFLEIVTSESTPYWKEFSAEVGLEWMKIPGARPHWAKMCHHIPGIEDHIRKEFGSRIDTFLQVKKDLDVDPKDIFYTQWLANILEPNRYPPYVSVTGDNTRTGMSKPSNPKDSQPKQGGCCNIV